MLKYDKLPAITLMIAVKLKTIIVWVGLLDMSPLSCFIQARRRSLLTFAG